MFGTVRGDELPGPFAACLFSDEPATVPCDYCRAGASECREFVYQLKGSRLRVLLSMRTEIVGAGYGVTGGGFIECGAIDSSSFGTVVLAVDEAFRESCEENADFEQVIGPDSLMIRAQPVVPLASRADDVNWVHDTMMFALSVDDSEWDRIAALSPELDQSGSLERQNGMHACWLEWDGVVDPRNPESYVRLVDSTGLINSKSDFCHPHEYFVITILGWMAEITSYRIRSQRSLVESRTLFLPRQKIPQ